MKRTPPWVRFWRFVRRTDDGCWLWTGGTDSRGYGAFRVSPEGPSAEGASRFAYELTNGEIPPGLFVCHRCDNPPCVRPDHLFLGTPRDNARDAGEKGRRKLLGPDVIERVRTIARANVGKPRGWRQELASEIGISPSAVSKIIREMK